MAKSEGRGASVGEESIFGVRGAIGAHNRRLFFCFWKYGNGVANSRGIGRIANWYGKYGTANWISNTSDLLTSRGIVNCDLIFPRSANIRDWCPKRLQEGL